MKNKIYYFQKLVNFLLITLLFYTKSLSAQKFDLFNTISGEGKEMIQVGEYIYISGSFSSSINFGATTLTTPAANVYNIYLAKYDTLGNLQWAQKGGNTTAPIPQNSSIISRDLPTGITADNAGNIYLTGTFVGDSCHWGNLSLTNIVPFGTFSNPLFIAKITPSGKVVWLNKLSAQDTTRYFRYLTASIGFGTNNLIISGSYGLPMVYSQNNTLISAPPNVLNDRGIWVAKLDTAGNMIQNKVVVTVDSIALFNGGVTFSEMEVTNDSTFFLSFSLSVSNNGDNFSFGNTQTLSAQSLSPVEDVFVIAKFSSFTNCNWIVHSNSRFRHNYNDVKILDDKHGGVYFTGIYKIDSLVVQNITLREDTNYTGSSLPIFYGKIDASGSLQALNSFENVRGIVGGISMNNKNEIIISGSYTDSIRVGGKSLTNSGSHDIFVINTDTAFTPNWYQVGGGSRNEVIVSTSSNNTSSIFFFLWYSGLAQFGSRYLPGNGSYTTALIGKLSECTNAVPSITFVGDTNLCLGDSVQLYTKVEPFSLLQWRKNNANLFGENFRDLAVGDSGIYDVITNQSGCIDTSANVNVAVEPFIASNLTLPDTLCENEVISLNGGSPTGGVYLGTGVLDSIFDPSVAGIGTTTISYTYNNVGCSDTADQNIQILTAPKPAISGNQQVCAFDSSSSYSTSFNFGTSYVWTVNGGTIASGQGSNSILVNWGGAGLGVISLAEVNTLGCDSTISDTVDIVSPSISASIQGADSACANSIDYSYSVSTPSLFYNWSVTGGVISSGIGSSSIQVRWNNVSQGYLSVQLFNSCGSNSTFYDTVSVFTKPTPSITGDSILCSKSKGINYAASTTGNIYQWKISNAGTIVSSQNTSSITVDWEYSAISEKVTLLETNSNGCIDSISKTVTLLSIDSSTIQANICQGASYSFGSRNLSTSGTYYDTLIGSNGCDSIITLLLDTLPNSSSTISANICQGETYLFNNKALTVAGTYFDTINSINGCDSIITLNLSVQNQLNDTVLIKNDTLIADQNGASYQWLECDTLTNSYTSISGATNRHYVPNDLDYYAVAINLNACTDTSLCYQGSISTGLNKEPVKSNSLSIYPNPTDNYILLKGLAEANNSLTLEIRTINGQLVYIEQLPYQSGQLNKKIDLSNYGKGIYFLRLIGLEQPFVERVIVK